MRMRVTKPDFWASPKLANLDDDWDARLVLQGLWSYVEDNGVNLDRPALIAAQLFPFAVDEVAVIVRLSATLDRLCDKGHTLRYEAELNGMRLKLIEVCEWRFWQKPDKPSATHYPTSEQLLATSSRVTRGGLASAPRHTPPPEEEFGVRSSELEGDARASRATPPPPCTRHPNGPDHDQKCKPCQRVREYGEHLNAAETQRQRLQRRNCELCDANGWLKQSDGTDADTLARCDHEPIHELLA